MNEPVELDLNDPTLAATLELRYLTPLLDRLLPLAPCAIDVGAHRGDMSAALADLGYRVLAIEPQPRLANLMRSRFASLIEQDALQIEQCAASDRRATGSLFVGSASTVNTLEADWTRIAFPEEFQAPAQMPVPLYTIAEVALARGFNKPAFVKIDVEGHELPALRGLFTSPQQMSAAPVVMFEANSRFSETALHCCRLLVEAGYDRFDIFIREGIAPIAAERFDGTALPATWSRCDGKYFYANIIAYHRSLPSDMLPASPVAFVESYHIEASRDLLRKGLALESDRPVAVHPIWNKARSELRSYLLGHDWRDFLTHPVCRHMFFRGRWGIAQERERRHLQGSAFGRHLLEAIHDPPIGSPRLSEQVPGLSTNLLGMLYYLQRLEEETSGELPRSVIEIGGGYGAFAYAYLSSNPHASYAIVDLPEMLAIQHYFLTQALPGRRICFAPDDIAMAPGQILLVPSSTLPRPTLQADLLFSTFGFSELPRALQQSIEEMQYFNARRILLAGQLSSEFPQLDLVNHGQVVGAAMQRFDQVRVERFHIGDNYLLIGNRSAA